MITVTHTCDKCKKEILVDKTNSFKYQFWSLSIIFACYPTIPTFQNNDKLTMHVCRTCLEDLGLVPRPKEDKRPEPEATLEDIIRDIVQDAIDEQRDR